MDLYDVMADGCHTPLTPQEIGELFHAGRFKRDEPCRKAGAAGWRTIDELFPLLKYGSGDFESLPVESRRHPSPLPLALACALAAVLLLLVGVAYFWNRAGHDSIHKAKWPTQHTVLPVVARMTPAPPRDDSYFPTTSRNPGLDRQRIDRERLEAEKRRQEELGREHAAIADQMRREAEEREQAARKAAGTDYQVPLDEDYLVSDPNLTARVRVHDNDVTSFDIWINGAHYRNVRKQKGTTHSRADETLVYRNGGASLYFVWEISGQLNHCLLRVREN